MTDRLRRPAALRRRLTYNRRFGPWRSLASALAWGARGPEFKSRRPDQIPQRVTDTNPPQTCGWESNWSPSSPTTLGHDGQGCGFDAAHDYDFRFDLIGTMGSVGGRLTLVLSLYRTLHIAHLVAGRCDPVRWYFTPARPVAPASQPGRSGRPAAPGRNGGPNVHERAVYQ